MKEENGRVTILPKQVRRLAELSSDNDNAIELVQIGSVFYLNNGITKLHIDANGDDVNPANQEQLC